MDAFATTRAFVLDHEGDFSDDPGDPGGATWHGITLGELRAWRGDPDLTVDDLRALSDEEHAEIFRQCYWNIVNGDRLPPGIALSVADFGFNAGPITSARMLQDAVGAAADGHIGPLTLAATRARPAPHLVAALAARQESYYRSLGNFGRFGRGWLARTADREKAALALTPT